MFDSYNMFIQISSDHMETSWRRSNATTLLPHQQSEAGAVPPSPWELQTTTRHSSTYRWPVDQHWTAPHLFCRLCRLYIYIVNLLHNKLSDVIRWRETSDLLSWEQGACLDFLTFHNKTILRKAVQSCFWWLTTDELHYIFYITSYSFSTRYQTGFTLMEVIFHRLLCLHTQYFTIFTQLWLRDVCRGILWNPALHCCELHVLGCLHIHSSEWYRPLTSD